MMKKKGILILFGILLVACITVIAIFVLGNKDSHRIIKIYEFEGDGVVKRDSVGNIEPYANMNLESGDNVTLNSGLMTLRLDDDKYVNVEENTEFSIKATGTSKDSKTTIELKKGAITNDIQNKLSSKSSYEINTPNVTISVRGTNYRVAIYEDETGAKYSRVSVFDGKVVTKLVYADGTIADEEVVVESGYEVIICEVDDTTDYIDGVKEIDYSTLPESVGGNMNDSSADETADNDANVADDTSEEQKKADLTQEEIDGLAIFAKYVSSTQAQAAEAVESMTIQLSDEVVMNTIGIMANDYMGKIESEELEPYVIPGTQEGGYMVITKETIDQYAASVFDYTDIVYYEQGNVMVGANGYEIWEHQGYCDTTVTVNETYMDGENYVIKGVANLNYSDIFDPMFMDAEFTFTVRRNPDSPFGFTYVDFVFGTVIKY
ncbi:MAG: hypothetical protein E7258_05685 [Lachnospiraceae bacterium]|nr:hypothetical protein [Lachnospiraceae bacterium]